MIDIPLWPPQEKSLRLVTDAIADGQRRICLALPTGGGKSRVLWELSRDALHAELSVAVYTNRKMLIEQLAKTANEFGLKFGVRSAEYLERNEMPNDRPMQICSIQTEDARMLKKKVWQLHPADRVFIDEAHLNSSATMQEIARRHLARDISVSLVGLTATPLGIGHFYDHLIVGGTNSELRACGALIPAKHFGAAEPDTSKIKKETSEYTENDIKKIMKVQRIFGNVIEWMNKLNPEHKPTILFAPGVAESIWFAEQFTKNGIPAAHIDGENCWLDGKMHTSDQDLRSNILERSRNGTIKVLCNRFVLREGIDAPWLAHGIFATIFGSLQSYLQSGGRLLRAHPSMDSVTIQDHGGNWHRHGSLNADRHWDLKYTDAIAQGLRIERLREKKEAEPCRCPKCGMILMTTKCPCGFQFAKRSRPVMMENGEIKEHGGDIFKPRFIREKADTKKLWTSMYFRAKKSKNGMTFRQAYGFFCYENHYYPPKTMPLMPTNEMQWFQRVKDVPREMLT